MEGFVYNHLGSKLNKPNRAFKEKGDEEVFTLKDFLDHKWVLQSNLELKKVFSRELKLVLKNENLFDLINAFFELENNLNQTLDQVEFEVKVINFDDFYKNLSPVLMRAILENSKSPDNAELILNSIKESLRISIEEELYQLEEDQF